MSDPEGPVPEHEFAALQEQLVQARAEGEPRRIALALLDLAQVTARRRMFGPMARYAEEAWDLAEQAQLWDVLGELSLLFADFCTTTGQVSRSYDHYANACAYARSSGQDAFWQAVERVDDALTDLVRRGLLLPALALCELLLAYEEYGGLGERDPAFAAHYLARRDWLERLRVQTRLGDTAAQN